MSIDENVKLSKLIDAYGELLSEKQKKLILDFVNNDMSLGEIAQNESISRSAVLDAVNTAKRKLYNYETKLKLCFIKEKLNEIAQNGTNYKSEITKLLEEL